MGLIKDGEFCDRAPLFQRVTAPRASSVFCFGAGGSGLAKEAQEMVGRVFGWDYMGDGRFEHGEAAECLASMFDFRDKLVSHESDGYFFLVRNDVKDQAAKFFKAVVNKKIENQHSLGLDNPEVLGWFDFRNGYFVSREAALRDAVKKMLDEAAGDDQVQT